MLARSRLRDLCRALAWYWCSTAPVWSQMLARSRLRDSQVRIAGTENTDQYWTNLSSHKLANVTGPISAFKSAQCCPSTGTVRWKSTFSMLAPKLGPAMALSGLKVGITPVNCVLCQKVSVRPSNGTLLVTKSALLRQTVLYVKKPVSGPLTAHHRSESRNYSGKLCWKSKTQSLAQ